MQASNIITWFEIPVTDMDRAIKFYETVFGYSLSRNTMGTLDMAWFPGDQEGTAVSGSLVCFPDFYKPSHDGSLMYFSSPSGDLENELSKVVAAGGTIMQPKKLIAEGIGYMGLFTDTEGNRLAMHSPN